MASIEYIYEEHTFLTNFRSHMLEDYQKAIEKFPQFNFEIKDRAFDRLGQVLPGYRALHFMGANPGHTYNGLSEFWRYLDSIQGKRNA